MIPLPDFVAELRRRMDKRLKDTEEAILKGEAFVPDSADKTALIYAKMVGRRHALREERNELDLLVKQINSGGI